MPEVKFGPYTLMRRIAVGGMAEVFLARPEKTGWDEYVVVKQILPQLAEEPELLQLFFDEARIASRIFHPGIIRILDVGEHDGVHFLAMEYVDGLDLSQLMKLTRDESGKQMPLGSAIRVAIDLARAVHFAHEAKEPDGTPLEIVHRDVSPQNVLISKKGEVKLGDFGIARATIRARKTQTGILRGKIAYVSPEQYLGQRGDRRVDVYAIGIVLYEMIAGRRPFMGEEAMVIQEVMTKEAPPVTMYAPSAEWPLSDVITTALSREPNERFPTANAFADALERLELAEDQETLAKLARRASSYRERRSAEEKEKASQKQRATMTLPNPSDLAAPEPLPPTAPPPPLVRPPTETLAAPISSVPTMLKPALVEEGERDPNLESLPRTIAMTTPPAMVRGDLISEGYTVVETHPGSIPRMRPRKWSSRSVILALMIVGLFSGWMVSSLRTEDSDTTLQGRRIEPPVQKASLPQRTATAAVTAAVTAGVPEDQEIEPEGDADEEERIEPEAGGGSAVGPKKASPGPKRTMPRRPRPHPKRVVPHPAEKAHEAAAAVAAAEEEVAPKGEGELSLDTTPWSYVFLGKRELGMTPLAHVKVPAGKQKVRLENPERGVSKTILLNIEANKATALRLDLSDGARPR